MKDLARNATWGASSAAVRAATGLSIALMAVRLLGGESYGQMVTLLSLFVVYLALNSSVFTVLVTRLMYVARTEPIRSDKSVIAAAILLTLLSIAVLAFLTILLWAVVPVIFSSNSHGSDSIDATRQGVILMGLLTAVQIMNALHSAVIEAAGRLDLAMKWQLFGPFAGATTLLLLFIFKVPVSLAGFMIVLCCGAILDLLLLAVVRRRLMPLQVSLRFSVDIRQEIVLLLKSGTTLQAASLMGIFLEPLNKFLLSNFAGALAVTAYDLAMKLIWGIQSLFAGGMRVFLHLAREQGNTVSDAFYRVIALVLVPALALHVLAAVFLTWVVHHWVVMGDAVQIMIFFALATVSNLGMIYITPAYISLIGRSDLNFIFRSQSIVAITNIVASLVLIPFFGLLGAVFGLLCATAYNVAAIYRRHERVVGVGSGVSAMNLTRSCRFVFTVLLFCGAILMGTGDAVNYYAAGIILVAITYGMKNDPLLLMLYARLKGSQ